MIILIAFLWLFLGGGGVEWGWIIFHSIYLHILVWMKERSVYIYVTHLKGLSYSIQGGHESSSSCLLFVFIPYLGWLFLRIISQQKKDGKNIQYNIAPDVYKNQDLFKHTGVTLRCIQLCLKVERRQSCTVL